MGKELTEKNALDLVKNYCFDDLSVQDIFSGFLEEEGLLKFAPDQNLQIDPRDNTTVLFNSARAKRPHDNKLISDFNVKKTEAACPICEGNTTQIVDMAKLSRGFTFINKNLFPVFYPFPGSEVEEGHKTGKPYGIHFLQWTSSVHDNDWHNMKMEDLLIVITRLAELEKKLLFQSGTIMPNSSRWNNKKETFGFVSIIKNYGKQVGGSLMHGHQQISFSNTISGQQYNNWKFYQENQCYFTEYLMKNTPENLVIKDYGASVLVVPYFMKRPYNCILAMKNVSRQFLCELDNSELLSVCQAWSDVTKLFLEIMPEIDRDSAFNILIHNGPGAGLYLEFLPYTQETGGYEQIGLWICQADPVYTAEQMRNKIN